MALLKRKNLKKRLGITNGFAFKKKDYQGRKSRYLRKTFQWFIYQGLGARISIFIPVEM